MASVGVALAGLVPFVLASQALAEGSPTIAAAPQVVYGQLEAGDTHSGGPVSDPSNSSTRCNSHPGVGVFWLLPVVVGDRVTIDWQAAVHTTCLGVYPVGTTDYTVDDVGPFDDHVAQTLDENGKNETQFTAKQSGSMPLVIWAIDDPDNEWVSADGPGDDRGPYSFTAYVQHAINLNLVRQFSVPANGGMQGSALLATGAPVSDGLSFTLTATWRHGGEYQVSAKSAGGKLTFPLHLPTAAVGHKVKFAASRAADAGYLATSSNTISATVTAPRASSEPTPQDRSSVGVRRTAVVRHRLTRVVLKCRSKHGCSGTLRLTRRRHTIGKTQFSISHGRRAVTVKLSRWARRRLAHARHHRLRVRATIHYDGHREHRTIRLERR